MTAEQNFFINLPKGKTIGICQPANSSVWKDGGLVVKIKKDCKKCSVAECMMFTSKLNSKGKTVNKIFTEHDPAW